MLSLRGLRGYPPDGGPIEPLTASKRSGDELKRLDEHRAC